MVSVYCSSSIRRNSNCLMQQLWHVSRVVEIRWLCRGAHVQGMTCGGTCSVSGNIASSCKSLKMSCGASCDDCSSSERLITGCGCGSSINVEHLQFSLLRHLGNAVKSCVCRLLWRVCCVAALMHLLPMGSRHHRSRSRVQFVVFVSMSSRAALYSLPGCLGV